MVNNSKQSKLSDNCLIELNKLIQTALQDYLPEQFKTTSGAIRFDMVSKENLPDIPTVCVFLYDIQEDLELRHAQPRQYDPLKGTYAHRQIHVRCCYLLTYWEKSTGSSLNYDGQFFTVMNSALNGLLNMQFPEAPSAFIRVVEPSERLSSLGNFWQSLGDKPRLCLNFTVTVPIDLGLSSVPETTAPVLSTELASSTALWEEVDLALNFKRELVSKVTDVAAQAGKANTDWTGLRAQLARLQVVGEYHDKTGVLLAVPILHVSGFLNSTLFDQLTAVMETMQKEWKSKAQLTSDVKKVVPLKTEGAPAREGGQV